MPGGEGEGPCRDLPSPGHSVGTDAQLSPTPERAAQGLFLGERAAFIWELLLRLPGCLLPSTSSSSPGENSASATPGRTNAVAQRGAGLCRCSFTAWMKPPQRRASVSLPSSWQERCSITPAKHPAELCLQKCPSYHSSNPPFPRQGKLGDVSSCGIKLLPPERDAGSALLSPRAGWCSFTGLVSAVSSPRSLVTGI